MSHIDFWFEWGESSPFWSRSSGPVGPIRPDDLPISAELADECRRLSEWHDRSLNWLYPPDPGPWRQEECDRFNQAVVDLFDRAKRELGHRAELTNRQPPLVEDSDLDEYLKDPKTFRRRT